MITPEKIEELVKEDRLHEFYNSWDWKKLRRKVLKKQNDECQICKQRGKVKTATTVHHVNYVKKCPALALSETFIDENGEEKQNLIALCHDCHEELHNYRNKRKKKLNTEKW